MPAMMDWLPAAAFQPENVPSSVANRKVAGEPSCKVNSPDDGKALNTWPVGAASPLLSGVGGAMVTGEIEATLTVAPLGWEDADSSATHDSARSSSQST